MEHTKDRLRDAVKSGLPLSVILADLLENLTPELEPLIPVDEIDRNAEEVLSRYR